MRGTRHFVLTEAGRVLRDAADRLLRQAEETELLVSLALQGKAGRLRVGFGIATLSAGLGSLLRDYRARFPEVQVSLQDMSSPAQIAALENSEIDVGFVRLPLVHPNLAATTLFEERLVVAYPKTLIQARTYSCLSDFATHPFVALQPGVSTSYSDHFQRTCRAAGFTPRVVQQGAELLTLLYLVGAGIGVALIPQTATHMNVPHVAYLETGLDESRWQIGIARRHDREDLHLENFVSLALTRGGYGEENQSASL